MASAGLTWSHTRAWDVSDAVADDGPGEYGCSRQYSPVSTDCSRAVWPTLMGDVSDSSVWLKMNCGGGVLEVLQPTIDVPLLTAQ